MSRRIAKFGVVGLIGTGFDFAVFTLLTFSGLDGTISRAIGYVFGTVWAFFLNRGWVFDYRNRNSRAVSFSLTYLFSGIAAVWIQSSGPNNNELTSITFFWYGVSVIIAASINYLALRLVVFPDSPKRK
jgi:putative flippase GtrA